MSAQLLRISAKLSMPLDKAISQLETLPPKEALAVLEALEERRKRTQYIRYWKPNSGDQATALAACKDWRKLFGFLGGNRAGKTEVGAFLAVAWALGKNYFRNEPAYEWVKDLPIPEPPNNVWVVGLDFGVLRDVIWREKLRSGLQHPPFLPSDQNTITKVNDGDFQVFCANGSVITGKSADSGREKFQSAEVDLIWIDEECEEDVYDECYQRTLSCAGKILLTLTPLADINSGTRTPWVFNLYEEWKRGNRDYNFQFLSMLSNPFVPEEEKRRAREKWAGNPEEQARLYGKFVRRSGLVYPQWAPSKHVVTPFPIPKTWRRFVSIDPAATGVTAALWGAVSLDGDNLYLTKEYYERDKIVSEHCKNIIIRNAGEVVDVWLLDPTWGEQREAANHKTGAQLYRESGLPVRLPEVGPDFGLNVSREYLNATVTPASRHPKVYIFDGLSNFRFEIEHYTWDFFHRGENKGLSKEKPRKRHDHLMNAFQYLCAIRPRGSRRYSERQRTPDEIRRDVQNNSYSGYFDANAATQ